MRQAYSDGADFTALGDKGGIMAGLAASANVRQKALAGHLTMRSVESFAFRAGAAD